MVFRGSRWQADGRELKQTASPEWNRLYPGKKERSSPISATPAKSCIPCLNQCFFLRTKVISPEGGKAIIEKIRDDCNGLSGKKRSPQIARNPYKISPPGFSKIHRAQWKPASRCPSRAPLPAKNAVHSCCEFLSGVFTPIRTAQRNFLK